MSTPNDLTTTLCGTPEPPKQLPKHQPGPTIWLRDAARDAFYQSVGWNWRCKQLDAAIDAAAVAICERFDRMCVITPIHNHDRVAAMTSADAIELVSAHMKANVAGIKEAQAKEGRR